MYVPLRTRIEKDIIVRIYRSLTGTGQINVSLGQEVAPEDIIGSSNSSAGFRVLNLANLLSVAPSETEKYLQRKVGQRIYKDELLAQKKGFLGRNIMITSPADGILDYINPKTGELRMSFLPKKENLPSGVYGIVEGVDKEKGLIIIKTQASLVHGIFGSGRLRDGTLNLVGKKDEFIAKSAISSKYADKILVGGSLIFKEAISEAISCDVKGIIIGGVNAKDYKGMAGGHLSFPKKLDNDIGISIICTEGFGSISMGSDIYEILNAYNGKYISIDGNKAVIYLPSFESKSMGKIKATSLGPITGDFINHESEVTEIKLGLHVRIIGNSYPGEQGKIIAIDKSVTVLPSGLKANLATIETRNRKIQVPVANLEVIL